MPYVLRRLVEISISLGCWNGKSCSPIEDITRLDEDITWYKVWVVLHFFYRPHDECNMQILMLLRTLLPSYWWSSHEFHIKVFFFLHKTASLSYCNIVWHFSNLHWIHQYKCYHWHITLLSFSHRKSSFDNVKNVDIFAVAFPVAYTNYNI